MAQAKPCLIVMGSTVVMVFALPTVVIGLSGDHDFATNLAVDRCLDDGGRYDYSRSECEGPRPIRHGRP